MERLRREVACTVTLVTTSEGRGLPGGVPSPRARWALLRSQQQRSPIHTEQNRVDCAAKGVCSVGGSWRKKPPPGAPACATWSGRRPVGSVGGRPGWRPQEACFWVFPVRQGWTFRGGRSRLCAGRDRWGQCPSGFGLSELNHPGGGFSLKRGAARQG